MTMVLSPQDKIDASSRSECGEYLTRGTAQQMVLWLSVLGMAGIYPQTNQCAGWMPASAGMT
jgi:hypothetical protein